QNVSCVEIKMKSAQVPARQELERVIGLARSQPFCRTRGWDLSRIADREGRKSSALMNNSPLRSDQIVANSILAVAASALSGGDCAVPANLQIAQHRVLEQVADVSFLDVVLLPRTVPAKLHLDDSNLSYVSRICHGRTVGICRN